MAVVLDPWTDIVGVGWSKAKYLILPLSLSTLYRVSQWNGECAFPPYNTIQSDAEILAATGGGPYGDGSVPPDQIPPYVADVTPANSKFSFRHVRWVDVSVGLITSTVTVEMSKDGIEWGGASAQYVTGKPADPGHFTVGDWQVIGYNENETPETVIEGTPGPGTDQGSQAWSRRVWKNADTGGHDAIVPPSGSFGAGAGQHFKAGTSAQWEIRGLPFQAGAGQCYATGEGLGDFSGKGGWSAPVLIGSEIDSANAFFDGGGGLAYASGTLDFGALRLARKGRAYQPVGYYGKSTGHYPLAVLFEIMPKES